MIILEGFKLMFVGMTTVLLFLSFMILLLQLVSRLTRGIQEKELLAIEDERRQQRLLNKRRSKVSPLDDNDEQIAVISAAIAVFEAEKLTAS